MPPASDLTIEIAAIAARLVVDEGMEYGPAKRRAVKSLGRGLERRVELPDNDLLEEQVREHIALFCGDTQPQELAAMREVAALWMQRLAEFRPHLTGSVWRGTATRLSAVHLQLYCDDSKAAEIALINQRVDYDVGSTTGPRGREVDVLTVATPSPGLGELVTVHCSVLDYDDLRGGLKADAKGERERGDLPALRRLMESGNAAA
ncbi:MAG: hypothetical protein IV092_12450 [Burkholderiaceae bacterium]|nr:hypothetical protein [Burkholderiaceae bacterium]